jgi:catalase
MKFIGYVEPAAILFGKAGVPENRDDGFVVLKGRDDCSAFVAACRQLRHWGETKGKQVNGRGEAPTMSVLNSRRR